MHIDTSSEYLSLITSSDCLISDHSSLILEYFLTGKPIIFCPGKANNLEESPFKLLMNGFYIAESWDKIENILVDLRNGNDYLYKKRQELLKEVFYLPKESASEQIKNIIKANADKVIG